MTLFLTYELLTPETVDPVVIRITGQKARGIPWFIASNGIQIRSLDYPEWHQITKALWIRGNNPACDNIAVSIPLSDWPAVKQAIRELNEAKFIESFNYRPGASANYKEKDMKDDPIKEDRYEFPLDEWEYKTEPEPFEFPNPTKIVLTRKKPKVEVEWRGGTGGHKVSYEGYGWFHIVQFRVTGYSWKRDISFLASPCKIHLISNDAHPTEYYSFYGIEIRPDANGQWSAPVLLPESVYKELPSICKALEEKANA